MFLNAPINSSRYTDTHIYIYIYIYTLYIFIVSKLSHHWFITACRLSGSKLLSIIWTKLAYYHGYWSWELILMTFESKYKNFHSGNCICKRCLQNGGHFVFPSLCSIQTGVCLVAWWIAFPFCLVSIWIFQAQAGHCRCAWNAKKNWVKN